MAEIEKYSDFITELKFNDLPDRVVKKAKCTLLDFLAAALAGFHKGHIGHIVLDFLRNKKAIRESTVIGSGDRLACDDAALANGVFAHSVELDDGYRYGTLHPSVSVVPAALAVGEKLRVNGEQLLSAIVVGYEILLRIGASINKENSHLLRGFHTTSTCGPFGAAAATAKLLGLNAQETIYALSIAGLQGAGLQEVLSENPMIKPFQAGKASQSGVIAGFLAQLGAKGPKTILSGKRGFLRAMSDSHDPTILTDSLGAKYKILETYTKPYPTCRHVHPSIDLALKMQREHSIDYKEIEKIEIHTYSVAIGETGAITCPRDKEEAKFSIPYAVAVAFRTGKASIECFESPWLRDPEVLALARTVRLSPSETFEEAYPKSRGAEMLVDLRSGKEVKEETDLPKGEPETELSWYEIKAKFTECSKAVLSPRIRIQVCRIVGNLELLTSSDVVPGMLKSLSVSTITQGKRKSPLD
jgi:2-methylcitrate dehydratase PrpD